MCACDESTNRGDGEGDDEQRGASSPLMNVDLGSSPRPERISMVRNLSRAEKDTKKPKADAFPGQFHPPARRRKLC